MIRKTAVSYLSIVFFVTLGIALFLGFGWGSRAMEEKVKREFDAAHLHDFEILYPYGLEDDDLAALAQVEGVRHVEGIRYSYQFLVHRGWKNQVKIQAMTEQTDRFCQVEGNLPAAPDEIAVQKYWAEENEIAIGDSICFEHDADADAHALSQLLNGEKFPKPYTDGDGMKYLLSDRFTVTALVSSPAYAANIPSSLGIAEINGAPISCVMFVHPDAFDDASFTGCNGILIEADALAGSFRSDTYRNGADELSDKIRPVLDGLTEQKNDLIRQALKGLPSVNFTDIGAVILSREENGGVAFLKENVNGSNKLKYSLASLLVIIGLMVCYSAVTRLVQEHRIQIGTRKAMGFTNREITSFYLLYTGSAAVLGAVLGFLIAWLVIGPVVLRQMENNFVLNGTILYCSPLETLAMGGFELLLIFAATGLACGHVLKQDTVTLLSGPKPPVIRHRFFEDLILWKKLPLMTKTVVNNCFTDHRRMFATLTGVIGCTALIACGLSFRNSVLYSADYHYENLQAFDSIVYFDGTKEAEEQIRDLAEQYETPAVPAYLTSGYFTMPDGKSLSSRLIVTEKDGMRDMFTFRSVDGKEHELSEGPWIPLSVAEEYHLKDGDRLAYTDGEGNEYTVMVGGVSEYYSSDLVMYMDQDACKKQLGERKESNVFLLDTDGKDAELLFAGLMNTKGYVLADLFRENSKVFIRAVSKSMAILSMLYLFLSFAMAVLVILNLLYTFVREKKRELTILLINGYSTRQAKKYIYSDTIFLSVLGILLGLVLGVMISRISIDSVSTAALIFLHETNLPACLISAAISALLTLLMSVISLKEIDHMDLVLR